MRNDEEIRLRRGKWQELCDFAERLRGDKHSWEIVVRFYAALHLLEAYMLTKGTRFEAVRHEDRKAAIRKSPELRPQFSTAWQRLKDVSEQVRYEAGFRPREQDFENTRRDLEMVHRFIRAKVAAV
jgi:hypothetical protein